MEALHIVESEPSKTMKKLEESYTMLREYVLQLEGSKTSFQEGEEKISYLVHQIGRAAMKEALAKYDVRADRIARFSGWRYGRNEA